MEQLTIKDLKEAAAKALFEAREMEQVMEQQRNNEVSAARVPLFHTPLGVEQGTQRARDGQNLKSKGHPSPGPSYSAEEMSQRLLELTPGHRTYFCYWVDLFASGGYGRQVAKRRALAITLAKGPMRLSTQEVWRDGPKEGTD